MADVLVLCYHAVSARWPAPLSITPAALERQVTGLLRRGWVPATFTDAVLAPPARRTLAITFDDAFASVGTLAGPLLTRLGAPATVFVPTDWPDRGVPMQWPGIDRWIGTEHERELQPLSWSQLRGLADGGWEIGAHTCSHPHLTTLDDDRLASELRRSRELCAERMQRACRSIAYPYGDVDARVVAATGAAGYETAAALSGPRHRPGALEWPRVGVWHADGERHPRFRLKTAGAVRRLRARARR
jgi:peptidoglycan/xylan/chitin deacetylase (PgdA/CDA1 family)